MPGGISYPAEMGEVIGMCSLIFQPAQRSFPCFQVDVRRREWRHCRSAAQRNSSYVAGKNRLFPAIGEMMLCVAGCIEGSQFHAAEAKHFIVLHDVNLFARDRPKLAPERSHPIAINLSSRSDQLAWINKMRRAAGMHMDLRAGFGKAPR